MSVFVRVAGISVCFCVYSCVHCSTDLCHRIVYAWYILDIVRDHCFSGIHAYSTYGVSVPVSIEV